MLNREACFKVFKDSELQSGNNNDDSNNIIEVFVLFRSVYLRRS